MRAGFVEHIEHRQDFLNVFGFWVRIVKGIEQRVVFGTQLILQLIYLLKQLFSLFVVFLLKGLNHRLTETVDLTIGQGLRLVAADVLDDIFFASSFNSAASGC